VRRIARLNQAFLLYASDHDDVAPLAVSWTDGLDPYVTQKNSFHSPVLGESSYGYALNSAVAGQGINGIPSPAATLSVFDSTASGRNAVADSSTLPNPPRYGTKNTRAFLDGSVADFEGENPGPEDLAAESRRRLKQLAVGVLLYAGDNDDWMPLANRWVDGLAPYVRQENAFRSPAVERTDATKYGYAMNLEVAGVSLLDLESPANTIVFFESTQLHRNATASLETEPSPARYPGGNARTYADGAVR